MFGSDRIGSNKATPHTQACSLERPVHKVYALPQNSPVKRERTAYIDRAGNRARGLEFEPYQCPSLGGVE